MYPRRDVNSLTDRNTCARVRRFFLCGAVGGFRKYLYIYHVLYISTVRMSLGGTRLLLAIGCSIGAVYSVDMVL